MELGPISLLDCLAFVAFLIPQLILHAPWLDLLSCAFTTLPGLLIWLPYTLLCDYIPTGKTVKPSFVRHASFFQLLVIRCVRFAFANMPASIGKVFFSKGVALPFYTFRKLRHGYWTSTPIHWEEIDEPNVKGLWIIRDAHQKPDVILMYSHGGGFSMGSSYFYIEFLLAWVSHLEQAGFKNPALFALDYTLVPEASYPTQLDEAKEAYRFVLSKIGTDCPVCVAGDSAGATLTLSLVKDGCTDLRHPDLAILISPWPIMQSRTIKDTSVDFLNVETLNHYGRQYVGNIDAAADLVSPGLCQDLDTWRRVRPTKGFCVVYGSDEVLASDIKSLISTLEQVDEDLYVHAEKAWAIHAWPVVKLYLGGSAYERYHGVENMARLMRDRLSDYGERSKA